MASLKLIATLIAALSVVSAVSITLASTAAQPVLNAAETLTSSGYTAMALTLQVIAPSLPLPASTHTALTIFSPPDSAFAISGQPSLVHLFLHFCPLSLSPASLLSLPFSSTIPSLSPAKRLVVTSTGEKNVSIDNVTVSVSPLYDDGLVIVYAIDDFFALNFTLSSTNKSTALKPESTFQCLNLVSVSRFEDASGRLKSRSYSIIASFLDLQIFGFLPPGGFSQEVEIKWTVFAPADEDLVQFSGDFLQYYSLFMRHLVPCKVGWGDLEDMENGTVISNNLKGFGLEITKDENDDILMVNGVEIVFPELFDNEWLVIHGIRGVIALPESTDGEIEPSSVPRFKKEEVSIDPHRGEF